VSRRPRLPDRTLVTFSRKVSRMCLGGSNNSPVRVRLLGRCVDWIIVNCRSGRVVAMRRRSCTPGDGVPLAKQWVGCVAVRVDFGGGGPCDGWG